jgi:hypothetical protein
MTLSISDTASPQFSYTPSHPAPTQQAQTSPSDSVTLSQSAQVSQLNHQGQSPSQIAQSLGITVSLVNLDLGIVATSVVSASPAVKAPAAHLAAAVPTPPTRSKTTSA